MHEAKQLAGVRAIAAHDPSSFGAETSVYDYKALVSTLDAADEF